MCVFSFLLANVTTVHWGKGFMQVACGLEDDGIFASILEPELKEVMLSTRLYIVENKDFSSKLTLY